MITTYVICAGDAGTKFDHGQLDENPPSSRTQGVGPHGLPSVGSFFPSGEGGELIATCPCVFRDEAAMRAALASPEPKRLTPCCRAPRSSAAPVRSRESPIPKTVQQLGHAKLRGHSSLRLSF